MLMMVWVIWSAVLIICALAWKLRCAVIMFTSCSVTSTLAPSSAPDCTRPKPELPAWPRSAWPEANVSAHCVLPSCCRPCAIGEIGDGDLAERLRDAVGEARLHDAGFVDVDADEAAGGVTVLRDRVDREVAAELRRLRQVHRDGHVGRAGGRACRPGTAAGRRPAP